MNAWYVPGQGLIQSTTRPCAEELYPLDPVTYQYCMQHFDFIEFDVSADGLRIRIDLEAYREHALLLIKNENFVTYRGARIYDDEHPFLGDTYFTREGELCHVTKDEHIAFVRERNKLYAESRRGILQARTPEEIDGFLGQKA